MLIEFVRKWRKVSSEKTVRAKAIGLSCIAIAAILGGCQQDATPVAKSKDEPAATSRGPSSTTADDHVDAPQGPPKPRKTWRAHDAAVSDLAFSPDGSTLASVSVYGLSGTVSHRPEVRLWDAKTGAQKNELLPPIPYDGLAINFSPDGETLVVAGAKPGTRAGRIELFHTADGRLFKTIPSYVSCSAVTMTPDGKTLLMASIDSSDSGNILLWDLKTFRQRGGLAKKLAAPECMELASAGNWLATTHTDHSVHLWGSRSFELCNGVSPALLAMSSDGSVLATVDEADRGQQQSIRIWRVAVGQKAQQIELPQEQRVDRLLYSPNGKYLIVRRSSDRAAEVAVFEADTPKEYRRFEIPFEPRRDLHGRLAMAVSPDGQTLALSGPDDTVSLWDLSQVSSKIVGSATKTSPKALAAPVEQPPPDWLVESPPRQILEEYVGVGALEFAHHDLSLFCAQDGAIESSKVTQIESDTEKVRLRFKGPVEPLDVRIALSADDKTLATCGYADEASGKRTWSAKLWDVATGAKKTTVSADLGVVRSFAVAPDFQTFVTEGDAKAGSGRVLTVWDLNKATPIKTYPSRGFFNIWATVSPDSKWAIWNDDGGSIRLVGLDGKTEKEFKTPNWQPACAAVSHDGKTLAACGEADDQKVVVQAWDVESGAIKKAISPLKVTHPKVTKYSPNDRYIAVASKDDKDHGIVLLIDPTSFAEMGRITTGSEVTVLDFSYDCKTLATGFGTEPVRLWDVREIVH